MGLSNKQVFRTNPTSWLDSHSLGKEPDLGWLAELQVSARSFTLWTGDACLCAEAKQASAQEAGIERLSAEAAQAQCRKTLARMAEMEYAAAHGCVQRKADQRTSFLHRQRVQVPELLGRVSELEPYTHLAAVIIAGGPMARLKTQNPGKLAVTVTIDSIDYSTTLIFVDPCCKGICRSCKGTHTKRQLQQRKRASEASGQRQKTLLDLAPAG